MRAVLFDLYETLVTNLDPDWVPPVRSIAGRLGVEETTYSAVWPKFSEAWESGLISSYQEALTLLCEEAKVDPDPSEIGKLVVETRTRKSKVFRAILPEIIDMLERLQQLDLKLGVVTNAHDLDTEPWAQCSIANYFDVFIASHEVGLRKPDRAIYALACDRLEVSPSDTYFVGDGGYGELSGAEGAGMRTFWCTWFLDKWPDGITPNPFEGGQWRDRPRDNKVGHDRTDTPGELVAQITSTVHR